MTKENVIVESSARQHYLVFADKTLRNIAMAIPKTHEDLLTVSGMGRNKAGKYSYGILEIMNSVV